MTAPPRIPPDRLAIEEIRQHVGRQTATGRLYDAGYNPLTSLSGPGDTAAAPGLAAPIRSILWDFKGTGEGLTDD